MAHQYIFTMQKLRRVHPPNKEVLKDIYLSFYPGAKIGVLGSNGAGKSTLLRIMAGVDTDFFGEAKPAAGIKIGFLPQEPVLDPTKTVLGNVEEAVAPVKKVTTAWPLLFVRRWSPEFNVIPVLPGSVLACAPSPCCTSASPCRRMRVVVDTVGKGAAKNS